MHLARHVFLLHTNIDIICTAVTPNRSQGREKPMKKRSHIFRGVSGIFLAFLVMFSIVLDVANAWSEKVNELLGTEVNVFERTLNPDDYPFKSDYTSAAELIRAEIGYATRVAAEGSVALKGMPAVEGNRVSLFGMRSGAKMQFGGSMGELVDASNIVTLPDALTSRGFEVNPTLVQFYKDQEGNYAPVKASGGNVVFSYEEQGAKVGEVPVSLYDASLVGDYKDAAIIVLGRDAGESCCFYPGENGILEPAEFTQSTTGNVFSLTNDERDLVNWVKRQGFGKVVVLLNCGTSMEVEELRQDAGVDAMLWIGNPGAYGTYGIADLLKGTMLPSGHLPDTWAVNSALSPAAQNLGIYTFANEAEIDPSSNHALRSSWYVAELEGIYTGYKYYETRYFDAMVGQGNAAKAAAGQSTTAGTWNYDSEVSFPFGFGLEGSTFSDEITAMDIDWTGSRQSTATVKVTNTGDTAAKHSVQLYVNVPYTQRDRDNGIEKSAIQLVAYAKTGESQEKTFEDVVLLQPGQSEEVTLTFNARDLYSYDRTYAHDGVTGAWTLEAGDYWFACGNGAHQAVNHVLMAMNGSADAHKEVVAADTYATTQNDVTVQNHLSGADLNTLGFSVTYLTRNDWLNSFPKPVESITATQEMIFMLRNEIYNQEVELAAYNGPASFTYGADNGVKAIQLRGLAYDDPLYDKVLDEMTLQDLVNQYLAYLEAQTVVGMPVESRADSPLGLIATLGQRTKGTIFETAETAEGYKHHTDVYPGGPVLAATFSPLLQYEDGRLIGNDALWAGYNTWFGPGMNLHRTPYNGRNIAYYSEDPVLTGYAGAYVHQALNKYGVVTQVKHFAFNDQETNRDGIAVFLNEQAARENELKGFEIGVREGDIKGMMSAFNRIGCVHVAASRELMNGILRGEWAWNGFMMTDSVKATGYFLPRECAVAGNDQMLGGSNNGKVWNMSAAEAEKDIVLQAHLRESYHRKLYAYANSAILNGINVEAATSTAQPWWVLLLVSMIAVSALGFGAFTALWLVFNKKERRH